MDTVFFRSSLIVTAGVLFNASAALAAPGDPLNGMSEQRLNAQSAGDQFNGDIAMADDGRFVVVWQGSGPGDTNGVYFRRFAADGTPVDAADQAVHAPSANPEERPAVAITPTGDFIVVWDDNGGTQVLAQLFASDGTAQGNQITIATAGSLNRGADVAIDADGDFVVVWEADGGSTLVINARTYLAGGTPVAPAFTVSSSLDSMQPAVAAVDITATRVADDFVVVWNQPDVSVGRDIFFERNPGPGTSNETGANLSAGAGDGNFRANPAVAMDAAGNFAIAWEGFFDAVENAGIVLRRFQSDTTPLDVGVEVLVNTTVGGQQRQPALALHDNGDLIVAWSSLVVDAFDVFFQRFAGSDLSRQGIETLAHSANTVNESQPAVAADPAGALLALSWDDDGTDAATAAVFGRLFEGPNANQAPPLPPTTSPPAQSGGAPLTADATGKGVTLSNGPTTLAALLAALAFVVAKRFARAQPGRIRHGREK